MIYAADDTSSPTTPTKKKGNIGLALGITAGVATLFGIAAAAIAAPSTSPATKKEGPTKPSPWKRTTTIQPGDRVRFSVTQADLKTLAASIPGITFDAQGFDKLLQLPQVKSALQTATIVAWSPGETLPLDWPPDDADKASEYHGEFVYGGTAPLTTSTLPIPVVAWTIPGGKPTPPPPAPKQPQQPSASTPAAAFAAWMDAAHASAIVYRGVFITTIPAAAGTQGAIALYLYPQVSGQAMYVAVHTDFNATSVTEQAMGFLASQGADSTSPLGDPRMATELLPQNGALYTEGDVLILVVPVRVAGTTNPIEYLALYHIATRGQTFLQALTAPSQGDAAAYAAQSIRAWKATQT